MTRTHEIEHLEEDAQRTREQLTNTVDTLRGRITDAVSPSVVTRDLQGYLVSKIRENPLQAAGLAAGLAFPLTRLLASMPAPVLLVGAGIALSKTNVTGSHQLQESVDGAKTAISEAKSTVQDAVERAGETATAALDGLADRADGFRASASEAADTAAETISAAAHEVSETFQQYPLLLGAIGLAVGALIGGAVPMARAEHEAFGEVSDEVKRKAGTLASETLEAAKSAAADVYSEAAEEARHQGLTAEKIEDASRTAKDAATNIVEKTAGAPGKKKS